MVTYNPKDWIKLIFAFHRSDTFRRLIPAMATLAVYNLILAYITEELHLINFRGATIVHSLLGFVISMLLVFRTNTAYDRWWEGRKLWGELVNNSRNLMIKAKTFIPAERKESIASIRILIANYAFALKGHLRNDVKLNDLLLHPHIKPSLFEEGTHIPNHLALLMTEEFNSLYIQGAISGDQLIMINEELKSFTNVAGGCERIRNSPIPYSYSLFIKKFIFIYVLTLPFGFLHDFHYWTIIISVFIFYAFASLELIAEEVEDPFGIDANDLPLDDIANRINTNLDQLTR